jgi:SpoVK/Ycf46/Vps4 family AAA+-type ATPase
MLTPATRAAVDDLVKLARSGPHARLLACFVGPPGAAKGAAAQVLARELGREILKLDLASVSSKWLGETEKNLRAVFDEAARLDAVLLLDEGDALLGRRTTVSDAHDRYASVETSYLLQALESHPGIIVICSNREEELDPPLRRRCHRVVRFP